MISDTEIKAKGIRILAKHLGDVEAERFIVLIQRESFDYTKWHQDNDDPRPINEISRDAMAVSQKGDDYES